MSSMLSLAISQFCSSIMAMPVGYFLRVAQHLLWKGYNFSLFLNKSCHNLPWWLVQLISCGIGSDLGNKMDGSKNLTSSVYRLRKWRCVSLALGQYQGLKAELLLPSHHFHELSYHPFFCHRFFCHYVVKQVIEMNKIKVTKQKNLLKILLCCKWWPTACQLVGFNHSICGKAVKRILSAVAKQQRTKWNGNDSHFPAAKCPQSYWNETLKNQSLQCWVLGFPHIP